MTSSPALPTDTYYRGYRLSVFGDGHPANDTHIYWGPDHIDTAPSKAGAMAMIDLWLDAK